MISCDVASVTRIHLALLLGSVTANTNTLAGQVPPRANLGDMSGLFGGFKDGDKDSMAMIDGDRFIGPKAYKAGGVLRTSTRPTLKRWTVPARLYEHSP